MKTKTILSLIITLFIGDVSAQTTYYTDRLSTAVYVQSDSAAASKLKKVLFDMGFTSEINDGYWNTTGGPVELAGLSYPVILYGMISKTDSGVVVTIKGKYDATRAATIYNGGRYSGSQTMIQIDSRKSSSNIGKAGFAQLIRIARKIGNIITFERVDGLLECQYEI